MDVELEFNMYTLYTENNGQISVNFFISEKDYIIHLRDNNIENYEVKTVADSIFSYFSSALEWDSENKNFIVNLQKAKEIKLNQYRLMRTCLFKKLDILFVRSLETEEDKQQIILYKQMLRDITTHPLPDDLQLLVNYYPEELAIVNNYLSK